MDRPLREEFAKVLETWATAHPEPDVPAMSLGGDFLSPRGLAEAVRNNTPDGQAFCEMVEYGAKATGESWPQVFRRFSPRGPG